MMRTVTKEAKAERGHFLGRYCRKPPGRGDGSLAHDGSCEEEDKRG